MSYRINRGVTQVEVLMVAACITLLLILTSVVFASPQQKGKPRAIKQHMYSLRDATHLVVIHRSMIMYTREANGNFPTPGLLDRLPVEIKGEMQDIPGRGKEDVTQNTTANFYSMLLMQHYITANLCISPVERNSKVSVKQNYDYESYSPIEDDYWDSNYKADLKEGSNTSYAHLAMFGKRRDLQWRDTLDAEFPVLSNRGPKDGALDPSSNTCGPHGYWAGNVAFNDNHMLMLTSTSPEDLMYVVEKEKKQDNLFAIDDGIGGSDAILAFTKAMNENGPLLQYD